jgi:hypothetical protein
MNLGSGILQALIKPAVQDSKASTDKNSQEQAKFWTAQASVRAQILDRLNL